MKPIEPIPLEAIESARARLVGVAARIPLVRLGVAESEPEIWLKLENLQPIGSFKLRGAGNAMALLGRERLEDGVYTASAGNMAQGVAWVARKMGVPARIVVPDDAPQTKLDAIERLGGEIIPVPFEEWWAVLRDHHFPGVAGCFVHPVSNPDVIAGNGTIGLEILEELPDVDAVVVPYGGGGLSSGIASAVRALRPAARVFAAEVETAAPLARSLELGRPTSVERIATFVDGIGGKSVLAEMWPLAVELLEGSLVVSVQQIADSIRLLAVRNRVIAEGGGAASVAAALTGQAGGGKIVCVVSGGNIDTGPLTTILAGGVP